MSSPIQIDKFVKVRSKIESKMLLQTLAEEKVCLELRAPSGQHFQFQIHGGNETHLYGKITPTPEKNLARSVLIAHGEISDSQLFFQTQWSQKHSKDLLQQPVNLFRLETRSVKRFNIPETTQRQVNIVRKNDEVLFYTGQCSNLSQGGAQILCEKSFSVQRQDHLLLAFHLNQKTHFEVPASVRYIQDLNTESFVFGVEFLKISSFIKNQIQALSMQILYTEAPLSPNKRK